MSSRSSTFSQSGFRRSRKLLSKITFGSFLVYAPRGTSELSNRAKQFVRALKEERLIGVPPQSPSGYAARRLADERAHGALEEVFGAAPLLVPVPQSSLPVEGGIWPAYNIAWALVAQGLGATVVPCLQRVRAVPKSAFATSGSRPKPLDHYESTSNLPLGRSLYAATKQSASLNSARFFEDHKVSGRGFRNFGHVNSLDSGVP